jgi:hypothetical protein
LSAANTLGQCTNKYLCALKGREEFGWQGRVRHDQDAIGGWDSGRAGLKQLEFAIVEARDAWKFTYIHALKTDRVPATDLELCF